MKAIIAGTRDFSDYDLLSKVCDFMFSKAKTVEIVSGGARGADSLGERYAQEHGYDCKRFPADWEKYGKGAGYKRNTEMSNYADCLIAFWDGESRGTQHMINLARKKGLQIKVVKYNKSSTIELSDSDLEIFVSTIQNPPAPNKNLVEAADRYKKLINDEQDDDK
jgi:uncharacterized protein (DUF1778 family)